MYPNNGIDVIEPIELFLSKTIDVDRLTMYQAAIDTIKKQARYSALDTVNSIIPNTSDETPANIESLIYDSLSRSLKDMILEYDVILSGGTLPFLTTLSNAIHLLDSFDQSQTIIDLLSNDSLAPHYRLYNVVCLIIPFDEEEYLQNITIVSNSLLERIIEVHQNLLNEQQADQDIEIAISTESFNVDVLKHVCASDPALIINTMLSDARITTQVPPLLLTALFKEYHDAGSRHGRDLAKELIGVYLVSGLTGENLLTTIREQLPQIENNETIITECSSVLGAVYQELTC